MLEAITLTAVLAIGLSMLIVYLLTGVPTMSSSEHEQHDIVEMLRHADLPKGAVVYELGAGWGDLLIKLAASLPDNQIRGIELSPLPCCIAWLRTRRLHNVSVRFADFRRVPMADADALVCYLMPGAVARLTAILDRSLRSGTPVICSVFWFRDRRPVASQRSAALYRWPDVHRDRTRQ